VFRVVPATLDERVVPWLPSRAYFSAGDVGEELAVDRVADPSFQRAQRFLLRLPVGLLAQVEGAAGGVVRDLGDGGHVQRVVELPVPTRVEPMTNPRS
jgi:hypothetical protein